MGTSRWSDDAYGARQSYRKSTGTTAFTYDQDLQSKPSSSWGAHKDMDPKGVTVRESCDSKEHPESLPIGVIFDVTGSMGGIPKVLQKKLGSLMRVITQHGYVEHPQVLFGAVGDAYTDRVPLQIGQFESGLEMDDDLGKIFLEGNGGGQVHESYGLAYYFFARHTAIDSFEKRGKKGYLFVIGDEMPYDTVPREHVRDIIGDGLEADLTMADVLAEAGEKFNVFFVIASGGHHGTDPRVRTAWVELLGERVLTLDDPDAVTETIAATIGLTEGAVDIGNVGTDLVAAGADAAAVRSATEALATYASTTSVATRAAVNGDLPVAAGSDGVESL